MLAALVAGAALGGCGDDGRRATQTHEFVDSIGVNVHMSYNDTAYGDHAAVRTALRDLGVRHVRDGVVIGREDQYEALSKLAADGIKANLILGDPRGRFGTGTLEEQISTLKFDLPDVAASVEGPNEYDSSGDPDWPATLRGYQIRLHAELEADPDLARLPVVGPSLIDMPAWNRVRDLSFAMDFGNIHPYPGGEPPAAGPLRHQLNLARAGSGGRPVMATETGYHNATRAEGGRQQPGVSESAAAVYLPALLLEHFRVGIARTFLYELVDEQPEPRLADSEQHFGLVRNDFTRKPAFGALQNMIRLLDDPGPAFEPGSLEVKIDAGAPVGDLLLQKRDGRFYLALWRSATPAWSKAARRDIRPAPVAVSVRFGADVERVRAYSPVRSREPIDSWDGPDRLDLQLGAEPIVLEIRE